MLIQVLSDDLEFRPERDDQLNYFQNSDARWKDEYKRDNKKIVELWKW